MSTVQITITTIDSISDHSNADALELAQIGGWQCVVPKGEYQKGDKIVYFPPDTLLPTKWTDHFGVTKYCPPSNGMQRIHRTRLRGEPSFGLVVKPEKDWPVDTDVTEYYEAEKYEPPVKVSLGGNAAPEDPTVPKYTDIENLRKYTRVFTYGEEVIATEKIHGTNVRIAKVNGVRKAGSRKHMRGEPENYNSSPYWFPWSIPEIKAMLDGLSEEHNEVVVYGETFGRIQSLRYNCPNGMDFRVFDIMINGKWVDYDNCVAICEKYGVKMVPLIARTPYSLEAIAKLSEGQTKVNDAEHFREGVVVKPVHERIDPKIGRVILKYISDTYLMSKHGMKHDTTDV